MLDIIGLTNAYMVVVTYDQFQEEFGTSAKFFERSSKLHYQYIDGFAHVANPHTIIECN